MNKNLLTTAKILAVLAAFPALTFARSEGADPGLTGAPGNSTCAMCHGSGTANADGGNVKITFPASFYTPGATSKVTVTITDDAARRWGFEITARVNSSPSTTQAGAFAPADGNSQLISAGDFTYLTHTLAGTRRGTTGPTTFEVNWTAPATNVGNVTFYVAANAADNNGSPSPGDHIYTSTLDLPAGQVSGGPNPALRADQPILQAFSGMPGMSPGTWLELYGTDLSTTTRAWTGADFNGDLAPTQLDGAGVLVDEVPAYVSYVSPNQVNALVPNVNVSGSASIVVTGPDGKRSAAVSLTRAAVSPALLAPSTFKSGTTQYVAANYPDLVTYVGNADLVPGAAFRPAKSGDYIILYAVGCGPTNPDVPPGRKATALAGLTRPARVTIGGKEAEIKYAGLYPPFVGLYRIDVIVPTLDAGDQAVDLSVDGIATGQTLFLTVGK